MTDSGTHGIEDLADLLQRERGLLEKLRYRFVALELLIDAREVRFLAWALNDLNRARLHLREMDLARAARVASLRLPGADDVPSLREVATAADAPWAGILRDHHDSLCTVVTEIETHSHRIAQQCHEGLGELARTGTLAPLPCRTAAMSSVGPSGPGGIEVGPSGLRAPGQAEDLDAMSIECLLSDVIANAGRLRMPALLAFLR